MSENLLNLVNTIRDRKNKDKDKSYTSSLLSGGLSKCIDKMEEEFDELKEAKQYLDSQGIPVRI